MIGVIVNTVAVLIGGIVGLLVNKGIPQRYSAAIMTGIGLCTIFIGISGSLQGENPIILVISIVLGAAAGTALKLDDRLNSLGEIVERRFNKSAVASVGGSRGGAAGSDSAVDGGDAVGDSDASEADGVTEEGISKHSIAQGFVTASLLFCVGAMTIVGSIKSGLNGDHTLIFTKSTLDLITSAILAVSLGVGVVFSAASVFVVQGLIVLLAQLLRPLLDDPSMLAEMNCAGSVIIIGLGLNLIGVTKIKVANYLPAIILAPVVYIIYNCIRSAL